MVSVAIMVKGFRNPNIDMSDRILKTKDRAKKLKLRWGAGDENLKTKPEIIFEIQNSCRNKRTVTYLFLFLVVWGYTNPRGMKIED